MISPPPSPTLSQSQLATLAAHGEGHSAAVGDVLFRVGDARYPLIAILEGEAAILDTAGHEIIRHRASGFLGEMNVISGQTVYVTAVVTQPMQYIAVDGDQLRLLLYDDGQLGDLLLSTFMARREALQQQNVGIEIIGPRSPEPTRRIVEFARRNRLPRAWHDPQHPHQPARTSPIDRLDPGELPLVELPGGLELRNPSSGELSRALGIGLELSAREEADLAVIAAGPAGLGAAVYGASEGLDTLVVESSALGGQAGASRRIENYLGFPAGITGSELASRTVTQTRKFNARTATPYRALALEPGVSAMSCVWRTTTRSRRALSCSPRVLTIAGCQSLTSRTTRALASSTPPGRPRRSAVALPGCAWSAAGTPQRRQRSGLPAVGRSSRCFTAGTTCARPCPTTWCSSSSAMASQSATAARWPRCMAQRHDENGFVLAGADVGADCPLETSVGGIYAAGDMRSGSIKRCASAVGEGAMVVSFVHERLAEAATPTLLPQHAR